MQATGELAELLERLLEVVADALEHRLRGRRIVVQGFLGHPEVEGEGDEALLGAVVQVPFEASPLGDACFDDAGARVPDLVELGPQLHEEALVLECEPGCAGDGVEQCRVLAQRRVVDERRDLAAVALEDRHRAAGGRNDRDGPPVDVHVLVWDRGSSSRARVRGRAATRAIASRSCPGSSPRPSSTIRSLTPTRPMRARNSPTR